MPVSITEYIDELDLDLLTHLQDNGRKSFTDIAKALGVSIGTVRNRLTRMLANNTLGIMGRVNPHHFGFDAAATIFVSVQPQHLEEAAAEIAELPEVSWLAIVTGEFGLAVDVMCRDVNHLTDLIVNRLPKVVGVKDIQTAFILRRYTIKQPHLDLVRPGAIPDEE